MYAALHYDIQDVEPTDVLDDIVAVLTGEVDIANLSSHVQPDDSYIRTTVSASNWELVGTVPNALGDTKAVFLRQPMSDDASRYRYMELFIPQEIPASVNPAAPGDPAGEGESYDFWAHTYDSVNPNRIDPDRDGIRYADMTRCVLVRWHYEVNYDSGNQTATVNDSKWAGLPSARTPKGTQMGEIYPPFLGTVIMDGTTRQPHANSACAIAGEVDAYNTATGVAGSQYWSTRADWSSNVKDMCSFAFMQVQGETMLLITASDKHVGFQSFYNNLSESSASPFLFEHTRLSAWDTVANEYDPYVITTVPFSERSLQNSLLSSNQVMPFFKFESMPNLSSIGTSSERFDYFKELDNPDAYRGPNSHHPNLLQISTLGGVSPTYNPGNATTGYGPYISGPNNPVSALGLDVNMHLDASLAYQPILIPFGCHNIGLGHFGGDISSGTGVYLMTSGVGQTHHALTVNGQDYRIWVFGDYRIAVIDG